MTQIVVLCLTQKFTEFDDEKNTLAFSFVAWYCHCCNFFRRRVESCATAGTEVINTVMDLNDVHLAEIFHDMQWASGLGEV